MNTLLHSVAIHSRLTIGMMSDCSLKSADFFILNYEIGIFCLGEGIVNINNALVVSDLCTRQIRIMTKSVQSGRFSVLMHSNERQ